MEWKFDMKLTCNKVLIGALLVAFVTGFAGLHMITFLIMSGIVIVLFLSVASGGDLCKGKTAGSENIKNNDYPTKNSDIGK